MADKYPSVQINAHSAFSPVGFDDLTGWADDDHLAALRAFCRSANSISKQGEVGPNDLVDLARLQECAANALVLNSPTGEEARHFFEESFIPHTIGAAADFAGFVTGYFEPELQASRVRTADHTVPLYRPPPELKENGGSDQPFRLDREAIQSDGLAGQDLELVWLKDKTDAYFVHIQGSARVILPDGETMRIAFAAKTGHNYTSLGKVLSQRLGLPPAQMTADRLADWMRQHPDDIDALMALNRSYIFFREVDHLALDDGPVGAAGVPLVSGRSLAVDHGLHAYGLPIWLSTQDPIPPQGFQNRLMIAHDTGSAIKGPQRGDVFVGTGDVAGLAAGQIQTSAQMTLLVPNP